ncbi:response regulator transcription factor [Salmonella enterica]|uniref:Response regulator transcription factor n=1 Tax=Salmonella enterica TaxID=28901 RepID=A0A5V1ABV2_SALER|nr:response regulator transcription factor [Salmonella enterica]EBM0572580.1 DNA-binding response regulator [Salmonella enterica]EBS9878542.1 response regulator transcription factor [Salmonella enterica]EBU2067041.1 response regulator transcription factor [Salmonella enterica]EFW6498519.1 response regulator transcription factor [Salmonella enterica]EGR8490044.1 response regulator transcription factor [Salmonella enterica]
MIKKEKKPLKKGKGESFIDNERISKVDLIIIEKNIKPVCSATHSTSSALIIDADKYIISALNKNFINPLVLHTCETFKEASKILNDNVVDYIFMELFNVEENMLDAIIFILDVYSKFPSVRVVVLTTISDCDYIQVLRSLKYVSIISKYESIHELYKSIQSCRLSDGFYSKDIEKIMCNLEPPEALNDIEWSVLICLAQGLPKREIASKIFKSYHGLFYHINKINKKLHIKTKGQQLRMLKSLVNSPFKNHI